MENFYQLVQENPEIFTFVFGLVNVFWVIFTYFNKQSHDKKMANLKHSLSLDLEKRKKVFELKASQYKSYISKLDSFGKKHQVDLPKKMQSIFDKYLKDYLTATDSGDKEKEREVIVWFSNQVSKIMQEGSAYFLVLKAESNKLKLTASDILLQIFEELEVLSENTMNTTNEFMSKFTEMFLSNNQELINSYQSQMTSLSEDIKSKSKELINQMRAELAEI